MVCHDLWVNVVRQGHSSEREQLTVARIATVAIAALAMFLGVAFEGQNVAFMAGLAFVAASANFPALLLPIAWKRFTTSAAVVRTLVGTFSALVMIWLSPTVQVDVLGKYLADVSRA
jgi:cation/acetate symporter